MQNHSAMMMMALKDSGSAKAVIGELVRNEVFRMIKFISEVEQLAYTADIARYVAGKMGIDSENRQFRELWRAQRKNVKKTLDSKRSTTSMAVKRVVISKYCAVRALVETKQKEGHIYPKSNIANTSFPLALTDLHREGELCELQEFLEMRKNGKAFRQFCDNILPCIVGRAKWDKVVACKLVSKMTTSTDEAWGLILLENSWDLWEQMANVPSGKVMPKERKATKWTNLEGTPKKNEGWGDKGIPRFNELMSGVLADRVANKEVEVEYLRETKERIEGQLSAKKRKRQKEDGSGPPTTVLSSFGEAVEI